MPFVMQPVLLTSFCMFNICTCIDAQARILGPNSPKDVKECGIFVRGGFPNVSEAGVCSRQGRHKSKVGGFVVPSAVHLAPTAPKQ